MKHTAPATVIIYNGEKDTFYSITGNVLKPMNRTAALAAIKHTSALVCSGNLSTYSISAVAA